MQVTGFLSLILTLTVIWMQIYARSREIFNGVSEYKSEISRLKAAQENENLEFAMQREQFIEFRQSVAALMPGVLREKGLDKEGYPFRSLASTIARSESEQVRTAIAKTLFERGKLHFRNEEFEKASRVFRQVIDRYGFSPYVAESYFLLTESQFKLNQLEECITVVQQMVELFPQHELTGFAMVRLGRIYEIQKRNDEAIDIYKTVLRSFPQRDVASQAKASLKSVDL